MHRMTKTVAGLIALFATVANSQDLSELEERALKAAATHVADSVVKIEAIGGLERVGRMLVSSGPTTGIVVHEDGYIVSSAFSFIQKPSSILVTLPGKKKASAKIVARDRSRMIVLLKVKTDEKLSVPDFVPRDKMVVGQWTIAMGRTFGDSPSVSVGVLSALNRVWGKAIQTDAKVSPNNYGGPIVNIRGQILGMLVPLSPRGQNEIAGAEWYDSGIGFAVPLAEVLPRLPQMMKGEDIHPGLLGISVKGEMYTPPVEIGAIQPKSPAGKAGLKVGDIIIKFNDKTIQRRAQLQHALGRHYAGDEIELTVKRKEQEVKAKVTLVDKLLPYEHPTLGILPARFAADAKGVQVRDVLPGTPAATSGIQVGDRLTQIDDKLIENTEMLREHLVNLEPKATVKVTYQRADESKTVEIALAGAYTEVPVDVRPAHIDALPELKDKPKTGTLDIEIPEDKNKCVAVLPKNYHPALPHALLVMLPEPGDINVPQIAQQWEAACEEHHMILLIPQPANQDRWSPTEVAFIKKTIDEATKQYNVDPQRVVVYGEKAGAAIGFMVTLANRDLIRGLGALDASLPRRVRPPTNEPLKPLSFYFLEPSGSKLTAALKVSMKALKDRKFSVVHRELIDKLPEEDERMEFARWTDALDRL